jgi:UDP-N-acetylglucosamine 4,6-dehydratase/5-epimerase
MILIIGATGTLGQELISQLGNKRIRAFSRCELKQKQLKEKFPHVQCYLGDIRDKDALNRAMKGVETVFHVAALKHIDVLEENPEESVKTNILGTINVCDIAEKNGVKRVVFSSTDKAVSPINVYGMSKGISEKIMLDRGHVVYRWGNITGSRGSAIHYFVNAIKNDLPVNLTHPDMSRFWIRIEDAVKFVLETYENTTASILIPPMKAAPVIDVINAIGNVLGKVPNIRITDLRRGEKIHESILEGLSSKDSSQYTPQELVELMRPYCV